MQRKTSLANIERLKLLPRASQPSPHGAPSNNNWACNSCTAAFDAYANPLYRCSTCSMMFCHGCVPLRALQSSYARLCHRCYKNLRGITKGSVLDLPPPDIASKLGELFKRGAEKPSAVASARRSESGGGGGQVTKGASLLEASSEDQRCQAEVHDRDVAAYMMLPTHVLEEFVRYFKREEDKQVAALSRWYVACFTRVDRVLLHSAIAIPREDVQRGHLLAQQRRVLFLGTAFSTRLVHASLKTTLDDANGVLSLSSACVRSVWNHFAHFLRALHHPPPRLPSSSSTTFPPTANYKPPFFTYPLTS